MADKHTMARPYARAAFDVAKASDAVGAWSDALNLAGRLLAEREALRFLRSPQLDDRERLGYVIGLVTAAGGKGGVFAGDDERGNNFLKLLIEYDRLGVMPEIAERFDALKADLENTVDVTVTSAVPLSDAQREQIAKALKSRLGRDVRLESETDESLIGGAVIRAGDVVIDGSLRARLEGLANALVA